MLSPRQLLALNQTPQGVQSAYQLYALGIAAPGAAPSPFSQGIMAEDMRANFRDHGTRVSWFQAVENVPGPGGETPRGNSGLVYVPVVLPDSVRVFVYQNTVDIQVEGFGLISKGTTMISWMPDEMLPVRDDRFLLLDRTLNVRDNLIPSGGATDVLGHKNAVSISAMWQPGAKIAASRYSIAGGLVTWNGAPPTGSVSLVYRYRPTYEFLGEGARHAFHDASGIALPSSAPLRLLSAGEE